MKNSTHINHGDLVSCPYAVSIFFTTTIAVISSAAFIGNILVFVAVCKTTSLRTSTNYYYVNMAVSDFLSSLVTWPLYLTDEIITSSGSLLQGSLATAGCKAGLCIRMVSLFVSILSLVLIAIDRFIATVFPLKAVFITRKIRTVSLVATWAISTTFSSPFFFYSTSAIKQVGHKMFCTFLMNGLSMIVYLITSMFVLFFAPFIAIVILYSRIMRALRKGVRPESETKGGNWQQKRNEQNQNIMKIFKSIVAAFVVSFSLLIIFMALSPTFPGFARKDKFACWF